MDIPCWLYLFAAVVLTVAALLSEHDLAILVGGCAAGCWAVWLGY